jgi:hypothetical protein
VERVERANEMLDRILARMDEEEAEKNAELARRPDDMVIG